MPAYNGIRGYWNEVRVNSNYKSKNAVPQGTELEAGMQTKRKKSRYVFWKTEVLFTTLFFAALLFAGCSVEQTNRTKISDLDYTIAAEADIPEELQNDIQLGLGQAVHHSARRKTDLRLLDLLEINRQQLRRAAEIVTVSLGKLDR